MREHMNPRVDEQVFRRTAAASKAVNLGTRNYRGGTRL